MNNHPESRITQERAADDSRLLIASINRDYSFKVSEGLVLHTIQSVSDEIGTFIDWQSYSDAWSRHCASPQCYLTERTDTLGANFRKVGCHGEFSRVDRMEAAVRGDTDLESTMQFTRGIVNISFTPC